MDLNPLVSLLTGGAVLGLVGVLLTTRESRQKRYDDRQAKTMDDLAAERDRLRVRNEELERENDRERIENARLRYAMVSHGLDPDAPTTPPAVAP